MSEWNDAIEQAAKEMRECFAFGVAPAEWERHVRALKRPEAQTAHAINFIMCSGCATHMQCKALNRCSQGRPT